MKEFLKTSSDESVDAKAAISGLLNGIKMAESYGFTYSGAPSAVARALAGVANTLLLARSPSNSFLVNKYLLKYNKTLDLSKNPSLDDRFSAAESSFNSTAMLNADKSFIYLKGMLKFAESLKKTRIESSSENSTIVDGLLSSALSQDSTDIYINLIQRLEHYFKEIKEKSNVKYSLLNELLLRKHIIKDVDVTSKTENFTDQEKSIILDIGQSIADLEYFIKTIQGNIKIRDVGSAIRHDSEIKDKSQYKNLFEEAQKNVTKQKPNTSQGQYSYTINEVYSNDFERETIPTGNALKLFAYAGPFVKLNIIFSGGISNNATEVFRSILNSNLISETQESKGLLNRLNDPNETQLSISTDTNGNNILTISFPIAWILNLRGKSILIFKIEDKNLTIIASDKHTINTNIKKISFTTKDLIYESSNISDLERKLILKKIKK